jgi:hypothetical protein
MKKVTFKNSLLPCRFLSGVVEELNKKTISNIFSGLKTAAQAGKNHTYFLKGGKSQSSARTS